MIRKTASCILFLFLVSCCILATVHTYESVNTIKTETDSVAYFAQKGNWNDANIQMEKVRLFWENTSRGLFLYSAHSRLDAISQTMAYMHMLLKQRSAKALLAENARLQQMLEELKETEFPLIENIF